jgi:electron-transferring-flavoprotein dehydrogenase
MLVGDAGGTLNTPKIKGIHQAIRSGMTAAAHFVEHGSSTGFDRRWRESPGGRELHKVRNIRPGFRRGLWLGLANAALETATFGKLPWTLANHADDTALKRLGEYASPDRDWGERELPPRDRVAFVFFAATTHDENQPVHLHVADTTMCATRCMTDFGNPCTNFCPANVYEMIDDGKGGKRLQINSSNCVHCKACDIKEPYPGQITWVTPEGGSGPNYQSL